MSAANAIYSRLNTTAAITDIVGPNIMPQYSPKDPYPRVIYLIDNDEATVTHDGPTSQSNAKVTVISIARTYNAADALAQQVKTALSFQSGTWGATKVQKCFLEPEREEQELTPTDLGEQGRAILISQHFDIWYLN